MLKMLIEICFFCFVWLYLSILSGSVMFFEIVC